MLGGAGREVEGDGAYASGAFTVAEDDQSRAVHSECGNNPWRVEVKGFRPPLETFGQSGVEFGRPVVRLVLTRGERSQKIATVLACKRVAYEDQPAVQLACFSGVKPILVQDGFELSAHPLDLVRINGDDYGAI